MNLWIMVQGTVEQSTTEAPSGESNKGSYTGDFRQISWCIPPKSSSLPFPQELTSELGLYCEAKLKQHVLVLK